jgi:hypothetical protein
MSGQAKPELSNGKVNGRVCSAIKHDKPNGPPEERVICVRSEAGKHIRGAMTYICGDCWKKLLEGKRRRAEGLE